VRRKSENPTHDSRLTTYDLRLTTHMDIQSIKNRFGIIGNSPSLIHSLNVAAQVANTDLSVLIVGESGVGKEAFSLIIHALSARKHNPFIAVNCGAIPEGTIDSELFGHEKGAFTGAVDSRKGYFETVNGGTIFLDEIGEMPLGTQAVKGIGGRRVHQGRFFESAENRCAGYCRNQ
jgi:transcriptional regulator with GAF, ATPase, and Fis domain